MLDYPVVIGIAAAAVTLALLHRFSAKVRSFDALVKFVLTFGAAFIAVSLAPHLDEPPSRPAAEAVADQALAETIAEPNPIEAVSEGPGGEEARLEEMATAAAAEVAEEIRNAHNLAARARAAGDAGPVARGRGPARIRNARRANGDDSLSAQSRRHQRRSQRRAPLLQQSDQGG